MAGINIPFQTSGVQLLNSRILVLPDPDIITLQLIDHQSIARFSACPLSISKFESGVPISVTMPMVGTVRRITLDDQFEGNFSLISEGITELLEIEPLPFFMGPLLRAIPGGVPVFYIGMPSANLNSFTDGDVFDENQPLGSTTTVFLGLLFQDRVCLEPWSWAEKLQAALQEENEDATPWTNFLAAFYQPGSTRFLKVLNHIGSPISTTTSFTAEINGQSQTISTDSSGVLDLSFSIGQAVSLRWLNNPSPGESNSLPVLSVYETGLSADPEMALELTADFVRGHVQVLELADWFGQPNSESAMLRYHTKCRVQPLVDGIETMKLIGTDLLNCVPAGSTLPADGIENVSADDGTNGGISGAYFVGWSFTDLELSKDLLKPGIDGKPYTYLEMISLLENNGSGVRLLVNKLFSIPGDMDDEVQRNAILTMVMITDLLIIASAAGAAKSNAPGMIILMSAQLLAPLYTLAINDLNTFLEDKMDPSHETFPKFNEIREGIAIRSAYPALHADNLGFMPITAPTPLPITVTDFLDGVGTWHQKVQMIKRLPNQLDDEGNQYIAYVGGIDMNQNRLDNYGHQGASAYHDVHSRITGPGVSDVFKSFEERYLYEQELPTYNGTKNLLFATPTPLEISPNNNARHIIQIGRTLFRPSVAGSAHAFPFARQGDNSTNVNIVKAIQSAKEYIYIEDQYFVPNHGADNTYLDALLDAADHCKRLIVVSPSIMSLGDIPFGHKKRAEVVSAVQQRWGRRALIGGPIRRPILPPSGRVTLEGRCIVYKDIQTFDTDIRIGPKARLPKTVPFWIWINGELMLAINMVNEGEQIDGHPVIKVNVIRGAVAANPRWGATARTHPKGSAATASQLRGYLVHAKTMMVDDIFVSIGSANINRRGLFFDGEMNVFAIPEQLKAASDNPAQTLRTRLWADQLGLPDVMAQSLLSDPMAGFELFRRHLFGGNRFMPLNFFDLNDDNDLQQSISSNLLENALMNYGMGWLNLHQDDIWNTFTDPTTIDDPNPNP